MGDYRCCMKSSIISKVYGYKIIGFCVCNLSTKKEIMQEVKRSLRYFNSKVHIIVLFCFVFLLHGHLRQ